MEEAKLPSFVNLDYKNISFLAKLYFYIRTTTWYLKMSNQCTPSIDDKNLCDEFLKKGVVGENDVAIYERRGKYYVLVRDEAILNAMRICQ